MRRFLLPILLLPVFAFALDYDDRSDSYTDSTAFSSEESVAIGVLTNEGAVQGYPDGAFRPSRLLNRAEFMKIAVGSSAELTETLEFYQGYESSCFPDVRFSSWFHPYVCAAETENIIDGYPDGYFHPERNVNYAEAMKILTNMYGYGVEPEAGKAWYLPYIEAAEERGMALDGIRPGEELRRGQMVRLVAAFLAEAEGELELYRLMERGEEISSSGSSSSSSLSSLSSLSPSSVLSSASSIFDPGFPARSHLLMLGQRTEPIGSASFFASKEPMLIRGVTVVMEDEYESIDTMYLMDSHGVQIGRLSLDPLDQTDLTWKASFATEGAYRLEKDTENVLGIEVLLKGRNEGGVSEELIQVDSFRLTVEGEWTHSTYGNIPADIPFPQNQTTQARILSVTNALAAEDALPVGTDQLVAGFTFKGEELNQVDLRITELTFGISRPTGVQATGWELGASDTNTKSPCSISTNTVSCSSIPSELGTVNGMRTLRLFADIALTSGTQNAFLQISLNEPGTIGSNGAIRWTDGTGIYTWVELPQPVARSTRFE
ncbi:MAG: S-layer homology domain-containing protein [Patescibacteria group bacterium]